MAETPEKGTLADKPPELPQEAQGPSSRLTATVVSLAALAIIGAATANFLPSFGGVSLPGFEDVSLPRFASFPSMSKTFVCCDTHTPGDSESSPAENGGLEGGGVVVVMAISSGWPAAERPLGRSKMLARACCQRSAIPLALQYARR